MHWWEDPEYRKQFYISLAANVALVVILAAMIRRHR